MSFGIVVDNVDAVEYGMSTLGTLECAAQTSTTAYFDKPDHAIAVDYLIVPKPLARPYDQVILPIPAVTDLGIRYKVYIPYHSTACTIVLFVR